MSRLSLRYENHIAHLCLTRSDKMNAMDQEMITQIIAAGEEIAASNARAVVLSGEGKAFCAGIDITSLGQMISVDPEGQLMPRTHGDGHTNQWQEVAMIWERLPIPVIAALHGPVFGAGCQLALGADIRIAAPDTRIAVMELKWGIVPDMGGMVLLPRLTSSEIIRRLTYTAKPISAEQALTWGVISEVAEDPLSAAISLAKEISSKSPKAIKAAKRLISLSHQASERDVLLAESREQAALVGQPEQMEVVAANIQKRDAVFE